MVIQGHANDALGSLTRKLSYRKDDRAMRPIVYMCGALKIFESPSVCSRLLFPKCL